MTDGERRIKDFLLHFSVQRTRVNK